VLKSLATLALTAVYLGALGFGATTLIGNEPPATRWVDWGGTSFSSPEQLRQWLSYQGLSYRKWARNHPSAAARLEGRELPPRRATQGEPRPASAVAAKAAPAKAAQEAAPVAAAARPGPSIADRLILLLLATCAAALVALAVLPTRLLWAIRAPALVDQHRFELATAGVSIAIGMAAAQLLSGL
jgi:hypothetical protein